MALIVVNWWTFSFPRIPILFILNGITVDYFLNSIIGSLFPIVNSSSLQWKNSANTAEELYALSQSSIDLMINVTTCAVSFVNGTYVSFGPNNAFIIKSLLSLQNKIAIRMAQGIKNPTLLISDSIRGTLVASTPQKLSQLISSLIICCNNFGIKIFFESAFSSGRYSSGYVGVHSNILLNNNEKFLLGEIQLHLFGIFDGTENCPKEFTHRTIYEVLREYVIDAPPNAAQITMNGNVASTLVFLFGMTRTNYTSSSILYTRSTRSPETLNPVLYFYGSGLLVNLSTITSTVTLFSPQTGLWGTTCYTTGDFQYFLDAESVQVPPQMLQQLQAFLISNEGKMQAKFAFYLLLPLILFVI